MSTDDHTDPRGAWRNRPVHVDALATRVISVLSDRQAVSADGLRRFVLDHLMRAILCPGPFSAGNLFEELRGHRVTTDDIIDNYVPCVARELGSDWVADDISFAQVTIGTLRLQSLVGEAARTMRLDHKTDQGRLHVLVLVPAGEQHFLGASVLDAQLRRMGCEVSSSYDEDAGSLTFRLMQDAPDLILITCARSETLESARRTVQTIRSAAGNGTVVALGGAIEGDEEELKDLTGVDIVTRRVAEAVSFCMARSAASLRL
ncbi:cobalamin-dependent protein [uncultured Roseobacter sp.]|uniref:cobalamin B12-binding domain-containing protein n=1 Tax=uncultured Roseobacter sp. TaxID=114847 RepID=UPI00262A80E8|nr:cobalamin-dependent protein [uncultured Roseobacter sp.]